MSSRSTDSKKEPRPWLQITRERLLLLLAMVNVKDQVVGMLSAIGMRGKYEISKKQITVITKYAWLLYRARIPLELQNRIHCRNWFATYLQSDNNDRIEVDQLSRHGRVDIGIEDVLVLDVNYLLSESNVHVSAERCRSLAEKWMVWVLLIRTDEAVVKRFQETMQVLRPRNKVIVVPFEKESEARRPDALTEVEHTRGGD